MKRLFNLLDAHPMVALGILAVCVAAVGAIE